MDGRLRECDEICCVRPREQGVEYFVEHHDGLLYILTNSTDNGNLCLKRVPVKESRSSDWELVLDDLSGFAIEDIVMFEKR